MTPKSMNSIQNILSFGEKSINKNDPANQIIKFNTVSLLTGAVLEWATKSNISQAEDGVFRVPIY